MIRSNACVWLLFLLLAWQTPRPATAVVPFYSDNGLNQTLAYRLLDDLNQEELQHEILNILGLEYRPKPKRNGKFVDTKMFGRNLGHRKLWPAFLQTSCSKNFSPLPGTTGGKYLNTLYHSLLDEETGELRINQLDQHVEVDGEVLSRQSLAAINQSDVIISFSNQRKPPTLTLD